MPLVFPVLRACINRGADPWSAFDAPVGLLAPCKTLAPLSQRRDGGVPRRPGGLPHNFRSIANSGKTSGISLPSCPTERQAANGTSRRVLRHGRSPGRNNAAARRKNAPTNGGGPEGTPAWKATLRCCDEVPRKNRRGARRNEYLVVPARPGWGWRARRDKLETILL